MAQFKIGQRVRLISVSITRYLKDVGNEGVIEARCDYGDDDWMVRFPGDVGPLGHDLWHCKGYQLAPILPPDEKAEQFLEWVRTLDKAPMRELQPDEMERVRSAG